MLAILILNISANVNSTTLKSKTTGFSNPKLRLYDSHDNQLTFDANCPNSPPTTRPDKININKIHTFFSLVAILIIPSLTHSLKL